MYLGMMLLIVCIFPQEVVRQICGAVNDQFQHLLAEQEAREMQRQQQQAQVVKPIMMKRLSTGTAAAETHHAAEKEKKKKKRSRQQVTPNPSPAHESVSEFEFAALSGSNQEFPTDWSTSSIQESSNPADILPERDHVLEEIGRHFSAITKDPSRRRGGLHARGPNVKRLSTTGLQGSAGRRRKALLSPAAESMESMNDMVPPLKMNVVKKHSGNRVTQQLEDATGIELEDAFDLLIPRGKPRRTMLDQDSFMQSDVVEPMDTSGLPLQQEGSSISEQGQSINEREGSTEASVLHTSLLLETMEEGEVETRIDGDESGTVLIQTHMSEKETAIVGEEGHASLIPASELGQNEKEDEQQQNETPTEGQSTDTAAPVEAPPSPSGTPPPPPPPPPIDAPAPPPPTEAPPQPPPEPVKPERQPWPGMYKCV